MANSKNIVFLKMRSPSSLRKVDNIDLMEYGLPIIKLLPKKIYDLKMRVHFHSKCLYYAMTIYSATMNIEYKLGSMKGFLYNMVRTYNERPSGTSNPVIFTIAPYIVSIKDKSLIIFRIQCRHYDSGRVYRFGDFLEENARNIMRISSEDSIAFASTLFEVTIGTEQIPSQPSLRPMDPDHEYAENVTSSYQPKPKPLWDDIPDLYVDTEDIVAGNTDNKPDTDHSDVGIEKYIEGIVKLQSTDPVPRQDTTTTMVRPLPPQSSPPLSCLEVVPPLTQLSAQTRSHLDLFLQLAQTQPEQLTKAFEMIQTVMALL